MTPRLKKMWELAIEEAKKLKEFSTDDEKKRLYADEINPRYSDECIYGRMTGNCYTQRAMELIVSCCPRVYKSGKEFGGLDSDAKLNGVPKITKDPLQRNFYSAIEMIIMKDTGGQEAINKLVPFIKGETKRITIPK